MEFVIRTVYSYELMLKANRFFLKKKKLFWGFLVICTLFVLGNYGRFFVNYGFDTKLFFYLLLYMAFLCFILIQYLIMPKYSLRKSKLLDAICTVTFTDEEFVINAESVHSSENASFKYSVIYKVMEDDKCFYLFRTKSQAHIIDKDGFISGNVSDFKEFLRSKIEPQKFKCK